MDRWAAILLVCFFALVLTSGCGCGGDGGDDEGEIDYSDAVDRFLAQLDDFDIASEHGDWTAYAVSSPVRKAAPPMPVEFEEDEETYNLSGDSYFIFLDYYADAEFAHDVSFVMYSKSSGKRSAYDYQWWPEWDDESLIEHEVSGDITIERIYPTREFMLEGEEADGGDKASAPSADYGDAPDDSAAYIGVVGKFPTRYDTANSDGSKPGAHALNVGYEMIGDGVSAEEGVFDSSDPDGIQNAFDTDYDDGVITILKITSSGKVYLKFWLKVKTSKDAPKGTRYINILVDTNMDGAWKEWSGHEEWVVKNMEIELSAGETKGIMTDEFELPLLDDPDFASAFWARAVLSRSPVDPSDYTDKSWDGSGEFEYGEVEDFYVTFLPWTGPDPDADVGINGFKKPRIPPPPAPGGGDDDDDACEFYCEPDHLPVDIECKAFVVNAGDRPGASWMYKGSQIAKKFFEERYGESNVEYYNKPRQKALMDALKDFLNSINCSDRFFIYIVGHGGKSGGGYIRLQKDGKMFKSSDLVSLLRSISPCCQTAPCDYYAGECEEAKKHCDLNVLIQGCYSGKFVDAAKRGGMNIMSSASKKKVSFGARSGNGSAYSNAFWAAFDPKNKKAADTDPKDGKVSFAEAAKYAEEHHDDENKKNSDPQSSLEAGCDCECDHLEGGGGEDEEGDVFGWMSGESYSGYGEVDLVGYFWHQTGDKLIKVRWTLNDSPPYPGSSLPGLIQYVFAFDYNNFGGDNYEGVDMPWLGGADRAYYVEWFCDPAQEDCEGEYSSVRLVYEGEWFEDAGVDVEFGMYENSLYIYFNPAWDYMEPLFAFPGRLVTVEWDPEAEEAVGDAADWLDLIVPAAD